LSKLLFVISSTAEAGHVGTHTYSNRCNLLLNTRWNLLPPFMSNEPRPIYYIPFAKSLVKESTGINIEHRVWKRKIQKVLEYRIQKKVLHVVPSSEVKMIIVRYKSDCNIF
jgi:diketogulonate reductase-like aldo/keto reductase